MPLQFEIFDADSGRFTYPVDIYDALLAEFDGLLDDHGSGQFTDKRYLAALGRLLTEAPDFVDVYAHIASHWHRQGKPKKTIDMVLLSYMRQHHHKDAVTLIEPILIRNPNGNQGMRYLLGSEALWAGNHDGARAAFEAEAAACHPVLPLTENGWDPVLLRYWWLNPSGNGWVLSPRGLSDEQ